MQNNYLTPKFQYYNLKMRRKTLKSELEPSKINMDSLAGFVTLQDSFGVIHHHPSKCHIKQNSGHVPCLKRHSQFFVWFSHVLRVVLQTADELCDWMALEADLIDCVEQRKPGEGGGVNA